MLSSSCVSQVGRGTCASAPLPPACRSSSWFRVWRLPFMCCCCRRSSWGLSSSSLQSCLSSMGWSSCLDLCLYWPFPGKQTLTSDRSASGQFHLHSDFGVFLSRSRVYWKVPVNCISERNGEKGWKQPLCSGLKMETLMRSVKIVKFVQTFL